MSVVAGLLYNSWLLGFWLNSSTTFHGLASDLEQVHHPYFWLFIAFDVLTSLVILLICAPFVMSAEKRHDKTTKVIVYGLMLFAVFTVIAALLPSECNITPILKCRVIEDSGLGVDALTSTIAALGLTASLVGVLHINKLKRIKGNWHYASLITLILWTITGLSFISLALTNKQVRLVEWGLLAVSGLIIILSGYFLRLLNNS